MQDILSPHISPNPPFASNPGYQLQQTETFLFIPEAVTLALNDGLTQQHEPTRTCTSLTHDRAPYQRSSLDIAVPPAELLSNASLGPPKRFLKALDGGNAGSPVTCTPATAFILPLVALTGMSVFWLPSVTHAHT